MNSPQYADDEVALKYQVFNGLFLTLPFSGLEKTASTLPLFSERCEEGLKQGMAPQEIVEDFFAEVLNTSDSSKQFESLFLYLQLIERQVVLFDAIEEVSKPRKTAFSFEKNIPTEKHAKSVRVVLTAHPTQFYPDTVLGIIDDLSKAVGSNEISKARQLLLQLGQTSFSNLKSPTPLSEAENLVRRYLPTLQQVCVDFTTEMNRKMGVSPKIELGFWPGGDRDGNPFVTSKITKDVAEELRQCTLEFYLKKMEVIKRRVTFRGVLEKIELIHNQLRKTRTLSGYESANELVQDLVAVIKLLKDNHSALNAVYLEDLLTAVRNFGFYTASLDIRQASHVHAEIINLMSDKKYAEMSSNNKIALLKKLKTKTRKDLSGTNRDTFELFQTISDIQQKNGERGLHRYIVSHTEKPEHVLEVLTLHRLSTGIKECPLDIVPLFESIDALKNAQNILEACLNEETYKKHLSQRGNIQSVMLGFSDGTKDGGYVTCNVEIRNCKMRLEKLGKRLGVEIVFFDGRGGPPARGGGNSHRYYRAVKELMPLHHIQLTVQGQTISSHYGSYACARENLGELIAACLEDRQPNRPNGEKLIAQISEIAHKAYLSLKKDDAFLSFLQEATPLSYFAKLNIASRPPRRNKGDLTLSDLRAITFVGAWAQMKLNVPGYYGLGYALEQLCEQGKESELKKLYKENLFFQTLIDNSMQALRKSYLPLTLYLESDKKFGLLAKNIREENRRTEKFVLRIAKMARLLEHDLVNERSIALREKLILPLLVIQHCALQKIRQLKEGPDRKTWEKLLLKSIPANINAGRNSA